MRPFASGGKGAAAEGRRQLGIAAEQAVAQQVLAVQADYPLTVVEMNVYPGLQSFLLPVEAEIVHRLSMICPGRHK